MKSYLIIEDTSSIDVTIGLERMLYHNYTMYYLYFFYIKIDDDDYSGSFKPY